MLRRTVQGAPRRISVYATAIRTAGPLPIHSGFRSVAAHLHPRSLYPICGISSSAHPVRRGFSYSAVASALGITILAAFALEKLLYRLEDTQEPIQTTDESNLVGVCSDSLESKKILDEIMATPLPPGRPGNLTPEQEAKLKELWTATLKVFGVYVEDETSEDNPEAAPSISGSQTTEKSKKKRLNPFSRKNKNDQSSESKSGGITTTSDYDDKYGQTKQFQAAVANLSPEDLRWAFWSMTKHDNPDALLLRFLRARKWDVEKALVMFISTLQWRWKEIHVDDDIMKNGEGSAMSAIKGSDPAMKKEGEDFIAQLRMGKSFLHGVDKEGRPMCIIRVRLHKQGEQSESSLERYTVYTIETARLFLVPPVDTAAIIFDMTGFSLANMDYSPVKFMIKCFEANYPESLGVVLVHKAPWVFQSIWNIIKGWLDPVVAGKVHFTKNVEELEKYIPRERIIKELGGDEDWAYQYIEPKPDEDSQLSDTLTRERLSEERRKLAQDFEKATLTWLSESTKPTTEKSCQEERSRLTAELKTNYWQMDPYVRARSIYDRMGMIQSGGQLDFYPGKDKQEKTLNGTTAATGTTTSPDDVD